MEWLSLLEKPGEELFDYVSCLLDHLATVISEESKRSEDPPSV